jgi:hypothetical protein
MKCQLPKPKQPAIIPSLGKGASALSKSNSQKTERKPATKPGEREDSWGRRRLGSGLGEDKKTRRRGDKETEDSLSFSLSSPLLVFRGDSF